MERSRSAFVSSLASRRETLHSQGANGRGSCRIKHRDPGRALHWRSYRATKHSEIATMKMNKLGSSDIEVTEVCLGTMTWGVQNSEEEAHAQLNYAIKERGINFLDTAELYPVPGSAPGWKAGRTEEYIGTWLAKNQDLRKSLVIATKVAGFMPASDVPRYRSDPPGTERLPARHDRESVLAACDASLRRLQTDYIDVYQLHWPDRYRPLWGQRSYLPDQERKDSIPMRETAMALKELLDSGKIRSWGLSNESTFGVCEWCRISDELGMPRPVTIQNMFCLTYRIFEAELAEACAPSNYNIGLLPWSVLGGGSLTGKYIGKIQDGKVTDEALAETRFGKYPSFQGRFLNERSTVAIEKYAAIAKEAGLSLATIAQAFCKTRWFIPSTIIGATSLEQLKENIDAFDIELSDEVLKKIDAVHESNMDPCQSV